MYIKQKADWAVPESAVTPEKIYLNRRQWLRAAGFAGVGLASWMAAGWPHPARAAIGPYPAPRNDAYVGGRALTPEDEATTYTNFYEFGASKNIWRRAQKLVTDPWSITIDGLVETPMTIDAEDLLRQLGGLEERIYRHRCVEAWAMTVPWSGVALSRLIAFARPAASAKFLRMETFMDPSVAPGQKQDWYPWPYVEGLTLDEASNDLAFLATGIYGKSMPAQNGAPMRLVVPWKYGFKSVKSIARFTFTDQQPVSFWEQLNTKEYGFWANVNPDVPHPRWSQASERLLGSGARVPTQLYNGYAAQVAPLYAGMFPNDKRALFY